MEKKLQSVLVDKSSNCWAIKTYAAKPRNDSDLQNIKFDNLKNDYTTPLDLENQVLDAPFLECESFINYQSSKKYQPISRDIKSVMKHILQKNRSILCREDFLKSRNNFDKSDATFVVSLDLMQEEVDKTVVKQEELFIKDESFDSKRLLDVLTTQDIDEAAKFTKKNDNRSGLNRRNNFFNEFVKQAANSINYHKVECPSVELRISHLERSQSKPWYFTCSKCDYRTNRKNDYMMHIEMVHSMSKNLKSRFKTKINATPVKSTYICKFCDHSTKFKRNLDNHVTSVHINSRNFKCHLCDFSANLISTLNTHLNAVHLKQKNHHCNFCDFSTARKYRLTQHIETVHTSTKRFKCDLCNYMANVKSYITKHHRLVHLKKKKTVR